MIEPPKKALQTQPTASEGRPDPSSAAELAERGREGSGLYWLLVESVRDYAIFALDPGGHILTWNQGAMRLKGYRPEEIIGEHFSIFYPPEEVARGKTTEELRVAAAEGRVEDEGWRIRKDGSRFWANVVITALRDSSGALVGFGKVTRDLTERRASEEALRMSEERFRLLTQSVRDYAIFMLDPDGRIATWNEGAQRIKGYTAQEIIGRHFSAFYPADDIARGKPPWELREATRDGRFEDEGWRLRKDGSRFWANVVITALRNPGGSLIGFTKVTRDLTERRLSEERALADARRLAAMEAANQAKSEFLATLSHELRTPLNAIAGYVDLLDAGVAGPPNEQQHEYLGRIRDSQQHLLGIINDLLNYSRIEAGAVKYDIAPVRADALMARTVTMVTPQAAAKAHSIRRVPCDESITLMGDRSKVEQILLNLLSNAVKFTPNGGTITLRCEQRRNVVALGVSDTGPGIPEDKADAIFEPFVQLGRNLTSSQEGAGLGLAISRDLARAMNGDVTVESTVGKGATFTLTLPAEKGA
jgi:PAS domain S-box-containing protein